MTLMVLSPSDSAMNVASADSGIDRNTAAVARMLPRNTRIMTPVSTRPIRPSWIRFSMALRTNCDWSNTTEATSCFGTSSRFRTPRRMPSTTAMVLASPPCLSTGRYTDGCPSTRTMLYWICEASSALPTSATSTEALPTVFSGRRLMSAMASTWLLA